MFSVKIIFRHPATQHLQIFELEINNGKMFRVHKDHRKRHHLFDQTHAGVSRFVHEPLAL